METFSNINTKSPFPKPIIYSLIFIGFGVVSSILGILKPFTIIGSWALEGIFAISYSFLILCILTACIYGIINRKQWALKATVTWYSINIAILFFNFILFARNIETVIQLKQSHDPDNIPLYTPAHVSFTTFASFLLGLVFALYIIINLRRNSDFFNK